MPDKQDRRTELHAVQLWNTVERFRQAKPDLLLLRGDRKSANIREETIANEHSTGLLEQRV